jgi:hypothetical protein
MIFFLCLKRNGLNTYSTFLTGSQLAANIHWPCYCTVYTDNTKQSDVNQAAHERKSIPVSYKTPVVLDHIF